MPRIAFGIAKSEHHVERFPAWHGTTIVTVRKGSKVVIAGDGQVVVGKTVMKHNAKKGPPPRQGNVIAGFAGATADAFTLFERLEAKLEQYPDQLMRACVELAKDWRTDRYLRRLEAMMIVADKSTTLVLTGNGDVLEPEHGVMAIGSGGNYALAAALALADTDMDAEEIARKAMQIAAEICVYTNDNVTRGVARCRPLTCRLQTGARRRGCRRRRRRQARPTFSPREIVSELDRYIIGQNDAKRAVAIALRNRWRRQQLTGPMREEVMPKNILMIGPTGVGKTEISRRLAKLAKAPFIKVEATKFTEVGYVGRDVEQIIRDLVEVGIALVREAKRREVRGAGASAGRGAGARRAGRRARQPGDARKLPQELRAGELDDKEIEIQVQGHLQPDGLVRHSRHARRLDRRDQYRRHARQGVRPGRTKTRKVNVKDSHKLLLAEEADKLLDQDEVVHGGDRRRREQRHRLPRRDRQDRGARATSPAVPSRARACSATCCR